MGKHLKIIGILLLLSNSLFAQNKFYATFKLPLSEFIISALADEDNGDHTVLENSPFGGAIGYSYHINKYCNLETGFDFTNVILIDQSIYRNEECREASLLLNTNLFSYVVKPVFRPTISAENDVFLNLGLGINYQRMSKLGHYYIYNLSNNGTERTTETKFKSTGNWYVNYEPYFGLDITTQKKLGFKLGLSYVHYNFNLRTKEILQKYLEQFNPPKKEIGNLLLTAGILF